MKVVTDTNVLVSAFLSASTSNPARILELFQLGNIELVISQPMLDEYQQALLQKKLQKLHGIAEGKVKERIADFKIAATYVTPETTVNIVDDPDNNMLFDAALEGRAEFIISSDLKVQAVKEYQGVRVVTPAIFMAFFEQLG